MRLATVGADLEESLGMRMIAAPAAEARNRIEVVPFTESGMTKGWRGPSCACARWLVGAKPDTGMSVVP